MRWGHLLLLPCLVTLNADESFLLRFEHSITAALVDGPAWNISAAQQLCHTIEDASLGGSVLLPLCPSLANIPSFASCIGSQRDSSNCSELIQRKAGLGNATAPDLTLLGAASKLAKRLQQTFISEDPTRRLIGDTHVLWHSEQDFIAKLVRDDDVVIDIGAHVGGWTEVALQTAPLAHLWIIEPVADHVAYLEERLEEAVARGAQVQVVQAAAAAAVGFSDFWRFPPMQVSDGDQDWAFSAMSSFYERKNTQRILRASEGVVGKIRVVTLSVDALAMAFFLPYINFLKVDVEGHELAVLQGAKWMLRYLKGRQLNDEPRRQHRIGALQFEYGGTFLDAGCSLRDICELLTPLGYSVFREIEKGGLAHIAHWEDQHEDFQIHNILAVVSEAVPGYQPMSGL